MVMVVNAYNIYPRKGQRGVFSPKFLPHFY